MKVTGILLALAVAAPAAAQRPAHPQTPMTPQPRTTHPTMNPATNRPTTTTPMAQPSSFKGIASTLNTTPDMLESAYQTALQANPKLTRGQFVAANVLAQNLGTAHANITTRAILDGLKSGNGIGQRLQSLGMSASDADKAEHDAQREIRAAGQAARPDSGR